MQLLIDLKRFDHLRFLVGIFYPISAQDFYHFSELISWLNG